MSLPLAPPPLRSCASSILRIYARLFVEPPEPLGGPTHPDRRSPYSHGGRGDLLGLSFRYPYGLGTVRKERNFLLDRG